MQRAFGSFKIPGQTAGQWAILLTAFLWSTSGLFIKLLPWHPVLISGIRSLIAFVFMAVVRVLFPPRGSARNSKGPLWAGAALYAFTMLSFTIANKLTASANAILLQYSAPVWAALLGWVLIREKPRWEHWAALGLIAVGLFIFFQGGLAAGSLAGDAIALLSGIAFGANTVVLRMMKSGSPSDSFLLSHLINFAWSIPFFFIAPPVFSLPTVMAILYMGIIQIGAASLFFSYGIKRVSAIQAMLTAMAEPVLNPVWVLVITGERPPLPSLAGGAVIIAAVAGSSVISRSRIRTTPIPTG
ncbi:MAG: DMT family transporter [Treponema sp.]|jgi:drug/metabolite transporter (DMT)-like permease|nr:DMT family transporter [Treponema sp.]